MGYSLIKLFAEQRGINSRMRVVQRNERTALRLQLQSTVKTRALVRLNPIRRENARDARRGGRRRDAIVP